MELIILFVVMVVVSVVVYFQLKGSKPEALTVSDLTVPYSQKVAKKKANQPEKKVVAEQWDKAEKVVKRDASPGEVKRRKNKPFDPVKEGLKVVAAPVKIEEGPAALTEKEEKAQKKRLEADGFVVVKEKAKPAPKVVEEVVEEVEVEEEVDLSPAAIRLAQLKAIIAGNSAPTQGYQGNKPRDGSPNQGYQGKKPTESSKKELSRDEIEKKIADQKKEKQDIPKYGGKIIAHDAAKKPSKLAPWAKGPIPVEKPKEAPKAEEAAAPEPEAPKEEEWNAEEEGAGGAAEW